MDNYSKVLTFFLENGVQLTKEQLEALQEEFLVEFNKDIENYYKNREAYEKLSHSSSYNNYKHDLEKLRDKGSLAYYDYDKPYATGKFDKNLRDKVADGTIKHVNKVLDRNYARRISNLKNKESDKK